MLAFGDAQWERIAPLMPRVIGRSRPYRDHRQVVERIVYRYRCEVAWRDVPDRFGPWQTVWKRHRRFSADGTWVGQDPDRSAHRGGRRR